MKKKLIIASLAAVLMCCIAWTARAEIRGFFLSCGLYYFEVPEGQSPEFYLNLQDIFEEQVCGQGILDPTDPGKESFDPIFPIE